MCKKNDNYSFKKIIHFVLCIGYRPGLDGGAGVPIVPIVNMVKKKTPAKVVLPYGGCVCVCV